MSIGDTLRSIVDINFPDNVERTVTYGAVEAELRVKFNGNKHKLPNAERVGWLIGETMKQMHSMGYEKAARIVTNVEMGIKLSISVAARRKSQYDTE